MKHVDQRLNIQFGLRCTGTHIMDFKLYSYRVSMYGALDCSTFKAIDVINLTYIILN